MADDDTIAAGEPDTPREGGSGTPEVAAGAEDLASGGMTYSARQLARVRGLLARFYGLRRAVRFYPEAHPAVQEGMRELMETIGEFHAEGVDVPLAFFEDELLLGDQLLPEDSILFDQLIRDMTAIGAGSVNFTRGLQRDELYRAMQVLALDSTELKETGGLAERMKQASAPHVEVGAVRVFDRMGDLAEGRESARQAYTSALDLMRELELVIRARHSLFPAHAKAVVRGLVDNILANRFAMLELSGLKSYDEYTFYHSVNVAILSLALGASITEDRRFLTSLGTGALMHDIGKMAVGTSILNKPGALDAEEWSAMRLHPVYGAEIAAGLPGFDRAAIVVILEHHMRSDGQGYPRYPRTGKQQRLASRIVAIADAFDAMTSRRAYSAARLQDDAMAVLVRNTGGAFDPALTGLFVRVLGVYPPRSVVRLDTDEVGVVLGSSGEDATRPLVRVFSAPDGTMVEPFDVDLSDEDAEPERSVVTCLDPSGMNVEVDDFV
jgi:HD-GYP domain-containing protein (c-di-GMP phosphodiesterase class II)